MRLIIDTAEGKLIQENKDTQRIFSLYTEEAFELISEQWLKVGWNQKYSYTFTWMGRPIIQNPEDVLRVQEVVYRTRPDVIIETGIAHGGSLVFYASLCKAVGSGRVIGIDIEIRPHNRKAIENHELYPLITLVEGNSIAPEVVKRVKTLVKSGEVVMVILDSDHSRQHVLAELEVYHDLTTPGSYIIVTDGIMKDLHNIPGGNPMWERDNPVTAVAEFVQKHSEFILEEPAWTFNESKLSKRVTYWPSAWLRKK